MCTLVLAYKVHPKFPFYFVGNRDEFFERPTSKATWRNDVLSGKDEKEGGTWTAISKNGKFAALTNFRNGFQEKADAPSRGKLITNFLNFQGTCEEYEEILRKEAHLFNGFNLLFGTVGNMYFLSNMPEVYSLKVEKGIHGVSNAKWNESWPKVDGIKASAKDWLSSDLPSHEIIFEDMQNKSIYPNEMLPNTNIPLEWEKALSALFVEKDGYGTRTTTIVTVDNKGDVNFTEKSHRPTETITQFDFSLI